YWVCSGRLHPLPPSDEQGIRRLVASAERICCKQHPCRGSDAFVALRHNPEPVGRRASGAGDEIVGGGEHLNRPRDVEQLHQLERSAPRWRGWGLARSEGTLAFPPNMPG